MPLNIDSRISTSEVVSGDDSGIPAATLHWDDSVTYTLDLGAALLFNFRPTNPISLTVNGQDMLGSVTVEQHPKYLRVTINQNSAAWDTGKATLFFEPVVLNQAQQPAAGGLDPVIINKGK